MATAKGANFQLMLIEETNWGETPGTPTGYIIPVESVGGEWFRRNLIQNNELRSNRNPAQPVRGNVSVSGSFRAPLHLSPVGWILKHGVGVPDTSGTGDPYTHLSKTNFNDSTEGGDLPVGLTIEHGYTDIAQYIPYVGCRIASIGIQASSEGVAMLDVSVVGKGMGTPAGTSLDGTPTVYTDSVCDHFQATIEEGGSSIAIVTDVNITINNGMDTSQYVVGGAGELADLPEGLVTVTGSATALFQNLTLLNKGINHTESSLELVWTSGTHSLTWSIPELYWEPASPTVNGPAGVRLSMNFQGFYANSSEKAALVSTLVNSVASY